MYSERNEAEKRVEIEKWNRDVQATQSALGVVAAWLANDCSIKVVWHDGGGSCYADMAKRTLHIPRKIEGATGREILSVLRGFVYHEAGHCAETKITLDTMNAIGCGGLHAVFNILEDRRMERVMGKRYPGCAAAFLETAKYCLDKTNRLYAEGKEVPNKALEALIKLSYENIGLNPRWGVGEESMRFRDLVHDDFVKIDQCASAYEALDLAKVIWEKIRDENQKNQNKDDQDQQDGQNQQGGQEEQGEQDGQGQQGGSQSDGNEAGEDANGSQPNESGESGEDGEDGSQSGGESGEDGEDGSQSGESGEDGEDGENGEGGEDGSQSSGEDGEDGESGEDGEDGESGEDGEDGSQSGESGEDGENGEDGSQSGGENGENGGDDAETQNLNSSAFESQFADDAAEFTEGAISAQAVKKTLDEIPEYSYTSYRGGDVHDKITVRRGDEAAYKSRLEAAATDAALVARAFSEYLRALTKARKVSCQRSGRLDARRFAHLAKGLSKQVFTKTSEGVKLDTAVEIIFDESGSMSEYREVRTAIMVIAEALDKVGIPFEVTGGTTAGGPRPSGFTRANPIKYRHYKTFAEPWRSVRPSIEQSGNFANFVDGEMLEYGAARLFTRKEKRKIIFSLSDGCPCSGDGNDDQCGAKLFKVCADLRKAGVEVYSFAIGTDEPARYYGPRFSVRLDRGQIGVGLARGIGAAMLSPR